MAFAFSVPAFESITNSIIARVRSRIKSIRKKQESNTNLILTIPSYIYYAIKAGEVQRKYSDSHLIKVRLSVSNPSKLRDLLILNSYEPSGYNMKTYLLAMDLEGSGALKGVKMAKIPEDIVDSILYLFITKNNLSDVFFVNSSSNMMSSCNGKFWSLRVQIQVFCGTESLLPHVEERPLL